MSATRIPYATAAWNIVTGCTNGCSYCWARRMANRLRGRFGYPRSEPFWPTYHVNRFEEPLEMPDGKVVAVGFMGDLCDKEFFDLDIRQVFWMMQMATTHVYLVLTRHPERLDRLLHEEIEGSRALWMTEETPPGNIWLGATATTQAEVDLVVPPLVELSARGWNVWLSLEPLLEPVDLTAGLKVAWRCSYCGKHFAGRFKAVCSSCGNEGGWCGAHAFNPPGRQVGSALDLVVVGGQSGPGSRAVDAGCVRSVRDACATASPRVNFVFKQWGGPGRHQRGWPTLDGSTHVELPWQEALTKTGRRTAP